MEKTTPIKEKPASPKHRSRYYFPWYTVLLLACYAGLLYASDIPLLRADYPWIVLAVENEYPYAWLALILTVMLVEFIVFRRKSRRLDHLVNEVVRLQTEKKQQADKYDLQIKELINTKHSLQAKVHKYTDHTNKLKLFISDKLLEYIEYDEKFLHFKGIASEVRHNGIISYDKVKMALKQASKNAQKEEKKTYRDALLSMSYLWDLLDLSTADNIAMYIANKLYEAEEQYYRQVLDESSESSPYTPTFSLRETVYRCVNGYIEDGGYSLPKLKTDETYKFFNPKFWVELGDVGALLGNENHIVLLLENLINNALFYQNSRKVRAKYNRVVIKLGKEKSNAMLQIYNHGPLITDEVREKIFQLGFSTKRTKENSGKGLGLYFVQQIVLGYEGRIQIENMLNHHETYILRIELESGTRVTEIIEVRPEDNDNLLCFRDNEKPGKDVSIKFKENIRNVEISVQSSKKTFLLDRRDSSGFTVLLDPENESIPRWGVEVSELKSHCRLQFIPLDVRGVQFNIMLPTAESRLDPEFYEEEPDDLDVI